MKHISINLHYVETDMTFPCKIRRTKHRLLGLWDIQYTSSLHTKHINNYKTSSGFRYLCLYGMHFIKPIPKEFMLLNAIVNVITFSFYFSVVYCLCKQIQFIISISEMVNICFVARSMVYLGACVMHACKELMLCH